MLGSKDEYEDHDGAECGVTPEKPFGKAFAADTIEVVGGEDGERRDGRKDVAGELRA